MRKGLEKFQECPICLDEINFEVVSAQYWLCCGQRMCSKCCAKHDLTKKGET